MTRRTKIKLNLSEDRNRDNALRGVPGWDPDKIRTARVMVVGAGALGNEVIKNLVLLNVGHLVIVDFDVVEFDNLAKSIMFSEKDTGTKKALAMSSSVKRINDGVKTLPIVGDISTDVGLGVFRRMDVVIGCLDNRFARMFINRHCFKVNKPWVDGALENLSGRFTVFMPGKSCYECSLTDAAIDNIKYRMGCPDIAKRNASIGTITTTPISSSIIGAFQVQEALKIIFGHEKRAMVGEAFHYDGINNFFLKFKEGRLKEDCDSHVSFEPIIEAPELSHTNSVSEVLDWLENHFGSSALKILVDEDIVLEAVTTKSGNTCHTAVFKNHLLETEEIMQVKREPDEDFHIEKRVDFIDRSFPLPDRTLKQIGIPFLDILRIETEDDIHFVELTGDEKMLLFK